MVNESAFRNEKLPHRKLQVCTRLIYLPLFFSPLLVEQQQIKFNIVHLQCGDRGFLNTEYFVELVA